MCKLTLSSVSDCAMLNSVFCVTYLWSFWPPWIGKYWTSVPRRCVGLGSDAGISSTIHSTVFLCLTQNWRRKIKLSIIENNFTCFILLPKPKFYAKNAQTCKKKVTPNFLRKAFTPSVQDPHPPQPHPPHPPPALHIPPSRGPRMWWVFFLSYK